MNSIESLEQIQKIVDQREPETERLEFKQLIDNKGAAKTIAGMANSAGGIILFGIREEQSRAAGISPIDLNGMAERIANIASDSIDEPLILKSTTPIVFNEGLGVLVVEVNPSERAPHFVNGQALIRSGPTTRPMSAHEIGSLFARRTSFTSEFRLESNLPADIIAKIESETRQRGMDHRGNFKSSTNYFLVLTNRGESDAFDVDSMFVNDEGHEATFPRKIENKSVKCLKGKTELRLPLAVAMGGDHAREIRLSWKDEHGSQHEEEHSIAY